jgi:hypothetical protein
MLPKPPEEESAVRIMTEIIFDCLDERKSVTI